MKFSALKQVLSHLITSRAVVDKIQMSNPMYETFKSSSQELESWISVFKSFDPKKPQTWITTGMKIASKVSEPKTEIKIPTKTLLKRFLTEMALVKVDQLNAIPFYQDVVQKNFKKSKALEVGEDGVLHMLSLPVGQPFFFYDLKEPLSHKDRDISVLPFVPDAMEHPVRRKVLNRQLADLFWRDKKHLNLSVTSDSMEYTIAEPGDRAYEGTLTELYEVLRLYMEGEVRRVVLFNGKPGTGKSTLALNLADALSKRTLILSHKTLEWTSLDDWVYILEMFQPEMLIIDDIDRLGSMLQKKLYLFEEKSCNVPLVVLTSNHKDWLPDAFKRPGRIDQIIDMETPSSDIRREVVKKIAMMEGVEIPEDRLDILDRIHRRYSGAYMVELFRRVKIEGWTYNIPSYDQTFNELHEALRTEWNQGPRKTEAPSPDDLSLDTFSD